MRPLKAACFSLRSVRAAAASQGPVGELVNKESHRHAVKDDCAQVPDPGVPSTPRHQLLLVVCLSLHLSPYRTIPSHSIVERPAIVRRRYCTIHPHPRPRLPPRRTGSRVTSLALEVLSIHHFHPQASVHCTSPPQTPPPCVFDRSTRLSQKRSKHSPPDLAKHLPKKQPGTSFRFRIRNGNASQVFLSDALSWRRGVSAVRPIQLQCLWVPEPCHGSPHGAQLCRITDRVGILRHL